MLVGREEQYVIRDLGKRTFILAGTQTKKFFFFFFFFFKVHTTNLSKKKNHPKPQPNTNKLNLKKRSRFYRNHMVWLKNIWTS